MLYVSQQLENPEKEKQVVKRECHFKCWCHSLAISIKTWQPVRQQNRKETKEKRTKTLDVWLMIDEWPACAVSQLDECHEIGERYNLLFLVFPAKSAVVKKAHTFGLTLKVRSPNGMFWPGFAALFPSCCWPPCCWCRNLQLGCCPTARLNRPNNHCKNCADHWLTSAPNGGEWPTIWPTPWQRRTNRMSQGRTGVSGSTRLSSSRWSFHSV